MDQSCRGCQGARLRRFVDDHVDYTVLRDERGLRLTQVGALHTTSCIGPLDIVTIGGLRVTSATRTIIDLAALGTVDLQLGAAIDSAVRVTHNRSSG